MEIVNNAGADKTYVEMKGAPPTRGHRKEALGVVADWLAMRFRSPQPPPGTNLRNVPPGTKPRNVEAARKFRGFAPG